MQSESERGPPLRMQPLRRAEIASDQPQPPIISARSKTAALVCIRAARQPRASSVSPSAVVIAAVGANPTRRGWRPAHTSRDYARR